MTTDNEPGRRDGELRRQPRSSIFLAAVLRTEDDQIPVKIRNMSSSGALVDSPLAPPPGTKVSLVRGALIAHGSVVWSSSDRCGLSFSSELSVKRWLAAPSKPEQERIDDIVALVRTGALPTIMAGETDVVSSPPRSDLQLIDDLEWIIKLMEHLEDELVSSSETVARHGTKLQNLDIAMQMLRAMMHALTIAKDRPTVSLAKMTELRVACVHALAAN